MDMSIIGTGYVGLVAGACFASQGHRVVCADIDSEKIAGLRLGVLPIFEPGLDERVRSEQAGGRLSFTDSVPDAVRNSDIAFIAVGTPPKPDGSSDLSWVLKAADAVASTQTGAGTIVIKSTVPVGTADLLRDYLASRTGRPLTVINNPEFLREGRAIEDFLHPQRVVIGVAQGQGKDPADGLSEVYAGFVQRDRILVMDSRSAELSKYAANAFLATKLSFINEMAGLSEAMGADIELVRRVIGMDARIGPGYLASGIGYGGSCLPKDVSSLLHLAGQNETPMNVLAGVQEANALQPRRLFERLACHFPGGLMGVRVAVWGLAFKPGTDDIREAPALTIVQMLARAGASAVAFDPVASGRAKTVLNGQTAYAVDAYACLQGADALVIATEWEHFREPDWARMREAMRGRAIFDGRNMYDPSAVSAQGFTYCSIGRRTAVPETAGVSTQV